MSTARIVPKAVDGAAQVVQRDLCRDTSPIDSAAIGTRGSRVESERMRWPASVSAGWRFEIRGHELSRVLRSERQLSVGSAERLEVARVVLPPLGVEASEDVLRRRVVPRKLEDEFERHCCITAARDLPGCGETLDGRFVQRGIDPDGAFAYPESLAESRRGVPFASNATVPFSAPTGSIPRQTNQSSGISRRPETCRRNATVPRTIISPPPGRGHRGPAERLTASRVRVARR